jgi:hypothetical protein
MAGEGSIRVEKRGSSSVAGSKRKKNRKPEIKSNAGRHAAWLLNGGCATQPSQFLRVVKFYCLQNNNIQQILLYITILQLHFSMG